MRKFSTYPTLFGAACLALMPASADASALAAFDKAMDSLLGFTTFQFELTEQDATSAVAVSLVEEIDLYQSALRFSDTDVPPAPSTRNAARLSTGSIGLAMAGFVGSLTNLSTFDSVRVVFNFDLQIPVQAISGTIADGTLFAIEGPDTFNAVDALAVPGDGSGRDAQTDPFLTLPSFPLSTSTSRGTAVTLAPGESVNMVLVDLLQSTAQDPAVPSLTLTNTAPAGASPAPALADVPVPGAIWSMMLALALLFRLRRA